jgi:triosephosphate isomerase (TIM)
MRLPFIAGNWKMNTTVAEAVKLVSDMRAALNNTDGVEIAVCPPYVSLAAVHDILKDSSIKVGAQNMYFEEKGAYTGEISPYMLEPLCDYVIIGHSERRQYFGETNEIVKRKIQAAVKAGLEPILCVGEKLAEYEAGTTVEVVHKQLTGALGGMAMPHGLVIAYEPIWAIGTGKAATGLQANKVISQIRQNVAGLYNAARANDLRILYGGSVTAENIAEFVGQPDIDGALVGGASLKTDQFVSIVKQTALHKK